MLEKLEEVYSSQFDESEKKWILENLEKLDPEQQERYIQVIQEEHSRRKGKPDIRKMKLVLEKLTGKKAKIYYWGVCIECGCEYDYNLPLCPNCYANGFACRMKSVKVSEFQPPAKVIRYNKTFTSNKSCYNCEHRNNSFCSNFGNPNWTCKREEFEYCECKQCCSKIKNQNREIEKERKEKKFSWAVPLNNGGENAI